MASPRKRPGTYTGNEGPATKAPKPNPFVAQNPPPQRDAGAGVEYEDDDEYVQLMQEVAESTADEMLYVPPKLRATPPEVPEDWTTISDDQLQNLYGAFSTFAMRSGFLAKIQKAQAKICKAAADEIYQALFAEVEIGKDASVTQIKAMLEEQPDVKRWRKRQHKHEAFAESHETDRANYRDMVESLSRLHSMRRDEWEMAGGRSTR